VSPVSQAQEGVLVLSFVVFITFCCTMRSVFEGAKDHKPKKVCWCFPSLFSLPFAARCVRCLRAPRITSPLGKPTRQEGEAHCAAF